jgi:hypothetical protein
LYPLRHQSTAANGGHISNEKAAPGNIIFKYVKFCLRQSIKNAPANLNGMKGKGGASFGTPAGIYAFLSSSFKFQFLKHLLLPKCQLAIVSLLMAFGYVPTGISFWE